MEITVGELEMLFGKIIDKLRFEEVDKIVFEADNYVNISGDGMFKLNETPEYEIGSLDDDLIELKKLIDGTHSIVTYVDFDRVSSVLKAISQLRNPI